MDYVFAMLIVLALIKILDLQRRITNLEAHDSLHSHKSVLLKQATTAGDDGNRTWVIPHVPTKRLSPDSSPATV